jgi:hypothetical protein
LVTPAGESMLIDSGYPGDRDADRVKKACDAAGVKKIDTCVAVVNGGPRKGGEAGTFATLKAIPSIQDIYQVHRNVRPDDQNPPPAFIANMEENGDAGNLVKMSVDPAGKTYVDSIPSTKAEKTYATRPR